MAVCGSVDGVDVGGFRGFTGRGGWVRLRGVSGPRLLFASMFVMACAGASPDLVLPGRTTREDVRGVWRSQGYGWVLAVDRRDLVLFHESAGGCYVDPAGTGELLELFGHRRAGPAGTIDFFHYPGEPVFRFERLAGLPAACAEPPVWDARRVLEVFVATMTEQYPFFAARGVDWAARVEVARGRVTPETTKAGLFAALAEALRGLEDAHVRLAAIVDGKLLELEEPHSPTLEALARRAEAGKVAPKEGLRAWLRGYRDDVLSRVLGGAGHVGANERVVWGRAAPRVGYINVMTMGGFVDDGTPAQELAALDEVLDAALAGLAGVDAMIVDVSNNHGGYDLIARALAGRFADTRRLAYTKLAHATVGPAQALYVEPSPRARFTGPVYVLTSDVTVSAGEVFVMTMRALPQVVQVGATTRGAFSDVLVKPLPNGWELELSNEVYRDAKGELFEGRGLPPALALAVFPAEDLDHGHAAAVAGLVAQIAAGTALARGGGDPPVLP